ncbi:MAG: D-xylose transporter XylE [Rhizomicrobium sp.]|jgi:SP family xylose:H+ symportor-like MFS transporter
MAKANTALVVALTLTAALGGLLFGYDTAVISGAVAAIDHNFINPMTGLSESWRGFLSGWTVSCALLGCVIGAAVAGPVSTKWGRKPTLMFAAVLFFIGSLGSAVPEFGFGPIGGMGPAALIPFIVYRVIGGIGVGIASMISPLYIAEIAPPKIRGSLVTFQQIAIVGGMLVVYFVNWAIAIQGNDTWILAVGWRWMLASEVIPSLLFFGLMLFVPDTPRWYVMRGKDARALEVLKTLTDDADANKTLKEIEQTLVQRTRPLFSFGALVIFVGIMLSVFQQLVGINAVLYYAPLMFKNLGASTDSAFLQTIVVGIAMVSFTVVSQVTVDRWGRKPLLITGSLVMAVSMLALGFLFNASGNGTASLQMSHAAGMWGLVAVVVYIAGFSLSWGPVVWVMLAEIFPNSIKGKAMAIAVAAQWIANLFVSITFKMLDGSSALNAAFNHGFAYWLYGVASLISAWFVMKYVPETMGRSLEAIQELWHRKLSAGK